MMASIGGTRMLLDIGGTHTRSAVALGDEPNALMAHQLWDTLYDYASFLAKLQKLQETTRATLDAVCVSFGVSLENGVVMAASKMPDFIGRRMGDDLRRVFKCESFIAHDCICALLSLVRSERITRALGYVTVSTGIGAGVAFCSNDVDIFQRVRLAHHVVDAGGLVCQCGRRGCLSAYLDSKAVGSRIGHPLHEITDDSFWLSYCKWLAVGLTNLAKMHELKRLIVGGGVMKNRTLRESLPAYFASEWGKDGYGECSLEYLDDSEDAPLRGAFYLARHRITLIKG